MATASSFQGLPITIEFKKGERKPDAAHPDEPMYGWEVYADYGYINGAPGNDGEAWDCYIGPDANSPLAFYAQLMKTTGSEYSVDYTQPSDSFDETKVLLGFSSMKDAEKFCQDQYGSKIGLLIQTTVDDIKETANMQQLKGDQQMRLEMLADRADKNPPLVLTGDLNSYGQKIGSNPSLVVRI